MKETVGETAGLEEDLQGVIERKSADKEVTVETLKHMRQILREQSHVRRILDVIFYLNFLRGKSRNQAQLSSYSFVLQELYCLRMRSALRAFKLMPVDAQLPVRKATKMTNKKPDGVIVDLSGCSSIASLPLPNSGNYSGVTFCCRTQTILLLLRI